MYTQRAFVLGQVALRGRRLGQIPGWGPGSALAIMPGVAPATTSFGPSAPMNATPTDPSAVVPAPKPSIADVAMMGGIAVAAAAAVYGLLS
jgi:hypothetical protein